MEDPETGDARISGTCASLCGLERSLEDGDAAGIEAALRRIELLHALAASLVGIPMIYSGDEIASLNDYSYEDHPHRADDNRWMHRPAMNWEVADKAARGEGPESRILAFVKRCLRLRRAIPALAQDAPFEVLPSEDGLLAVLRRPREDDEKPVLVLANFSESAGSLPIDPAWLGPGGAELVDLLEGEVVGSAPAGDSLRVSIGALRARWLARR